MMKSSILRRKSIELLKELIQILQEIIGSGDEESFRPARGNDPQAG